jgi:hypothetical protein
MVSKNTFSVRLFQFFLLVTVVLWACGFVFDNWFLALCSAVCGLVAFLRGVFLGRDRDVWFRGGVIQSRGIVTLYALGVLGAIIRYLLPDGTSWTLTHLSALPAFLLSIGFVFGTGVLLVKSLYKPTEAYAPWQLDRLMDFMSPLFYLSLSVYFFTIKPAPFSVAIEEFMSAMMLFIAWILYINIVVKNKWIISDDYTVQGMGLAGLVSVTTGAFIVGALIRSSPDYVLIKLVITMMIILGFFGSVIYGMQWYSQRKRVGG